MKSDIYDRLTLVFVIFKQKNADLQKNVGPKNSLTMQQISKYLDTYPCFLMLRSSYLTFIFYIIRSHLVLYVLYLQIILYFIFTNCQCSRQLRGLLYETL